MASGADDHPNPGGGSATVTPSSPTVYEFVFGGTLANANVPQFWRLTKASETQRVLVTGDMAAGSTFRLTFDPNAITPPMAGTNLTTLNIVWDDDPGSSADEHGDEHQSALEARLGLAAAPITVVPARRFPRP